MNHIARSRFGKYAHIVGKGSFHMFYVYYLFHAAVDIVVCICCAAGQPTGPAAAYLQLHVLEKEHDRAHDAVAQWAHSAWHGIDKTSWQRPLLLREFPTARYE